MYGMIDDYVSLTLHYSIAKAKLEAKSEVTTGKTGLHGGAHNHHSGDQHHTGKATNYHQKGHNNHEKGHNKHEKGHNNHEKGHNQHEKGHNLLGKGHVNVHEKGANKETYQMPHHAHKTEGHENVDLKESKVHPSEPHKAEVVKKARLSARDDFEYE